MRANYKISKEQLSSTTEARKISGIHECEAWQELGVELGFNHMTVRPINDGYSLISAVKL